MQTFTFDCPECGQNLEADETIQGEVIECPSCGKQIEIPSPFKPQSIKISKSQIVSKTPDINDAMDDVEQDVFKLTPSRRAYIGRVIGAFVWSFILAIVFLLWAPELPIFAILPGLFIIPLVLVNIWIKTHSIEYRLTNQRFFVKKGIISRHIDELELFRVKDVSSTQGIFQRLLGFGNILILSTDDTCPRILVEGIKAPVEMKELLRKTYRAARKREGVRSTEFIPS